MNAFVYARAVARYVDEFVESSEIEPLVLRQKRRLDVLVNDADMHAALIATLLETLPYERAYQLIPREPDASARAVAAQLVNGAMRRFDGPTSEVPDWLRSRGYRDAVTRVAELFFTRLSRGRTQHLRDLEHDLRVAHASLAIEATEQRKLRAKLNEMRENTERIVKRNDVLELLMTHSAVLELIVWSLFSLPPESRDEKLCQIVETIVDADASPAERINIALYLLTRKDAVVH